MKHLDLQIKAIVPDHFDRYNLRVIEEIVALGGKCLSMDYSFNPCNKEESNTTFCILVRLADKIKQHVYFSVNNEWLVQKIDYHSIDSFLENYIDDDATNLYVDAITDKNSGLEVSEEDREILVQMEANWINNNS